MTPADWLIWTVRASVRPRHCRAGWLVLLLAVFPVLATAAPYQWRNVAIGGGGFVTGLVFHPAEPDLLYARTDVGGAYRWDQATGRWSALTDWLGRDDANLTGIESLAVDPRDPQRVYLAAGTYTNPRVGNGAIIGAVTMVTNDVIPYGLVQGPRGQLDGLNLVGLKRRGVERPEITALRAGYQMLAQGEGSFHERAQRLHDETDSVHVREVTDFILGASDRSYLTPK